MNHQIVATSHAARLVHAVLRMLPQDDDTGFTESELLKHFPFARITQKDAARNGMHLPTTVHGSF